MRRRRPSSATSARRGCAAGCAACASSRPTSRACRRSTPGRGSSSRRIPAAGRADAFWLVGGRLVDWGPVQPVDGGDPSPIGRAKALRSRATAGARRAGSRPTRSTRCGWSRRTSPRTTFPGLDLDADLDAERLAAFADSATALRQSVWTRTCRIRPALAQIGLEIVRDLIAPYCRRSGRDARRPDFPKAPSRPRAGRPNGQLGDRRGDVPVADPQHLADARLAPHEREPDRAVRGGDRRRSPSRPTSRSPRNSGGADRHGLAQPQAAQVAVRLALPVQAGDRLLADVAALRERDGAVVEPCLLRDDGLVELRAPARAARLDAQHLERRPRRRARHRPRAARRAPRRCPPPGTGRRRRRPWR